MLSQLSIEIEYVILFLSIKIGVGNRNRCVQSKLCCQKGAKEIEVTVNATRDPLLLRLQLSIEIKRVILCL